MTFESFKAAIVAYMGKRFPPEYDALFEESNGAFLFAHPAMQEGWTYFPLTDTWEYTLNGASGRGRSLLEAKVDLQRRHRGIDWIG